VVLLINSNKIKVMIRYKIGNILQEKAEAIVNTVNCVGVMGRGIALQFKKAFPDNFKAYAAACKKQEVQPGKILVYETGLNNPRFIMNFPTKRHWKEKSRMDDIELGLKDLMKEICNRNIQSIAIPPLGSGLGGLNWSDVRARIQALFEKYEDLEVIVFEPQNSVPIKHVLSENVPHMTPGRAALVSLVSQYLRGLMDPFITLLEIHKLMYFLQEAGEPLKLKYRKFLYGPYAENLRHVLNAIEGHMISGYFDGGDQPGKEIELIPGALENAKSFLKAAVDTQKRLEKVADLVEGFEEPFGLELLATVHWVIKKEGAESIEQVVHQTYAWNERKKQFSERQIDIAYKVLRNKGWI